MGVAHLQPRDFLKESFARLGLAAAAAAAPPLLRPPPHTKCARYPNAKRASQPNRRRRSPPQQRQPARAASLGSNGLVLGEVRILKRGEEMPGKTQDRAPLKPGRDSPVPIGVVVDGAKGSPSSAFYATSTVFSSSPPPSDLPLPGFFTRKSVTDDATSDLRRILRLDVA